MTQAPADFRVLAGDDSVALPVIALGGAGLVSVASNAIPAEMSAMLRAAMDGDWATARTVNKRYFRLMQAHFWEPSPAPVKATMHLLGRLAEENLRLPMTPVTDGTRKRLQALIAELGLLEPAVAVESRRAS